MYSQLIKYIQFTCCVQGGYLLKTEKVPGCSSEENHLFTGMPNLNILQNS